MNREFINKYLSYDEADNTTHVSMIHPKGKLCIDIDSIDNFFEKYIESVEKGDTLGIAEKPMKYTPILIDVDIKLEETDELYDLEKLYTDEQVIALIKIYQDTLFSILENCKHSQLYCILLEKPKYKIEINDKTYVKNGFHIHFPKIFMDKDMQEIHLIPRVKASVKKHKLFDNLGYKDSGDVIDRCSCRVPWLLYGSVKAENMKPYKWSKCFDESQNIITLNKVFEDYKLVDSEGDNINFAINIEKYLPRLLSILTYNNRPPIMDVKKNTKSVVIQKNKQKYKSPNVTYGNDTKTITDNLNTARELLSMLGSYRADDFNEWITIGFILYTISRGGENGLDLWINFSEKCDEKFDHGVCVHKWNTFHIGNYSIGTLHYFAMIDNPIEYKKYQVKKTEFYAQQSIDTVSHNDLAKLLFQLYSNEFCCASISTKAWYAFNGISWEEIEEGTNLRQKLSKEVCERYAEMGRENLTKLVEIDDKAERAMYNEKQKMIQKIMANLKNSSFKNNVMKEAMEVFYDKRFKDRLNKNPMLIGFKNGIYDLELNKLRPGCPEDFISKCLPIEYKEYTEIDEEILQVKDFLQKVFPDSQVRKYFLDIYSDIFVGGNTYKKVYFWTGEGDNGKSITQTFFEKMLGELAIKFNTQYFTGKKASNGAANPELSRAAPPVRHATMEEPDADEQLNIGELKKLSGGDSYWARDLFETGKNTKEVFPMFSLTFICNKLPKLRHSDKATWNRIRVIPFESTFVDSTQHCPETLEEQLVQKRFPMDKTFASKIPSLVEPFAWYLLEWRKNVKIIHEPEKVKHATLMYQKQNDIFRQFIGEILQESESSVISITIIYSEFKEWFREGFSNMPLPNKNDVKDYFEKIWGDSKAGKWKGWTIKSDGDYEEKQINKSPI
jgi:P4 family phage/plasmid primase-like protien